MMNLGGPATLEGGRAVSPRALRRPRDHQAPLPALARSLHRPSPLAREGSRALRRHRRGVAHSSRHTNAARGGAWVRAGSIDSRPHGPARLLRGLPGYVKPTSDDALRAMAADGVERAIAFTQYPQFSCATTGSSLNEMWRALDRTGLRERFRMEHSRSLAGARRVHRVDDRHGARRTGPVPRNVRAPGASFSSAPTPATPRD